MQSAHRATAKYLSAHAEPEAALATQIEVDGLGEVLVIPSYGECESLLATLASIPPSPRGRVATIVVVNARADSPEAVHLANQRACSRLRADFGPKRSVAKGVSALEHPTGPLLLVERASEERFLPSRQGVGLARKIGTDLALAIVQRSGSGPAFIHCTDADALLPGDYFAQRGYSERSEHGGRSADAAEPGAALWIHPFRHVASEPAGGRASQAALEYEASLRYYVLGLRQAGSRYAFHTIGSTLAVKAEAYARVRGFPRRMAGEDFYLTNKLSKVGSVTPLSGAPLLLSDRLSDRVPFGTGAALRRARAGGARKTYPPIVFDFVAAWLRTLQMLQREPGRSLEDTLERCSDDRVDARLLHDVLRERGWLERTRRALEHPREAQRRRQHHEAFDAFETLKLIHAIRDAGHPPIELRDALAEAPFLKLRGDEDMAELCESLAAAERDPG